MDVVIANGEVVSQLKEGDYFGEIALLEDNCKRTASIRVRFCHIGLRGWAVLTLAVVCVLASSQAYGFCDLFVLTRENLESVLKRSVSCVESSSPVADRCRFDW